MIDIRDASLFDFLPESIASDPDIIALSKAIDPELQAIGAALIEAVILPRVNELSEAILDELAWAFRFNRLRIWDSASIEKKRTLLVNVFAIRKKSGTLFSIRRVFGLVSVVGIVVEWFQEAAAPYTYRLRLFAEDVGMTREQILEIEELRRRFAPTRCLMREFAVEDDRRAPLRLRLAAVGGRHVEISFGGP